jgi:peptidase E
MTSHILIRGGGHPQPKPYFDALLGLTGKPSPRVLYVPTAAGAADQAVRTVYDQVIASNGIPATLSFFGPVPGDLDAHLADFDVIYVGGGNTRTMLAVWRQWGFDDALRRAYARGSVFGGGSAGGLCWFTSGTTDSWAGPLRPIDGCLGFLPWSHCPHFDGEPGRRPTYHDLVARGVLSSGYALDDAAIMHFENDELREVMTLTEGKTAYFVEPDASGGETAVRESPLPARLLG